jgi:ketosteroid isomerase-like protein
MGKSILLSQTLREWRNDMTAAKRKVGEDVAIHALLDERIQAIRTKDVDRLVASHARDVEAFDLLNPLRYQGLEALRKRIVAWFAGFEGAIGYEIRDLDIAAGDDVAFCHFLSQVKGTGTGGQKIEMWWRSTVGFRRTGGQWLVTHEHSSVPFDMESGQASLDIKP